MYEVSIPATLATPATPAAVAAEVGSPGYTAARVDVGRKSRTDIGCPDMGESLAEFRPSARPGAD